MSFKTSGVLLLVLAVLGGYAYVSVFNKPPPLSEPRPYVYDYDMSDIFRMDVRYQDGTTNLVWDDEKAEWFFTDPSRGEVDGGRVNGIRLLLSGPGANRVLFRDAPTPTQLGEFGFDDPQIDVTIVLQNGTVHRVLVGDTTPDGQNYYTKNADSDTIYLVDYTWGDEIARFVTEPPIAKEKEGEDGA